MNYKDYIIGRTIKFTPSSEKLSLLDSPENFIVLTPACNRLLVYLVSNQGVVLSRDAIFSILWEQYGSTPSNSSLNTYVSLIRKAFLNLGFDIQVITTIPKTGFLFNPDIIVEEIETHSAHEIKEALLSDDVCKCEDNVMGEVFTQVGIRELQTSIPAENECIVIEDEVGQVALKRSKKKVQLFILVVGVLLTVAASTLIQSDSVLPVTPMKAGQIDSCEIMFIPAHAGDSVMFSDFQARFIVKQSGFTCKPGGVFYVYADRRVTAMQSGKIYVSYCEVKNKQANNCTDFLGDNVMLPDSSSN
ncbi:winged helix-turn-helix domain-containing protein [Serratia grimesii]|uniref:winged helix-turn-helix domain-containing protein n=1 Tax=Serratia grimesii TaxID=82995 RepID=UPI0039B0B1AC